MQRKAYLEMHQNEDIHWWFIARRKIIKKILEVYSKSMGKEAKKILEIGCGSGGNLQILSQYGKLVALELDDDTREIANQRNICLVKKGYLPDDIPFTEKFDIICMLDVLEHIEDDLRTLKEIKNKLTCGGKLLLTVPAYPFLWSSHDVSVNHKRRYVKKRLLQLTKNAGLNVIYATYFNSFLFPIIGTIRLFHNIIGKKEGTDLTLPSPWFNRILEKIFSIESILIPRISFPFGVSILLIAQNNPLASDESISS